MLRVNRTLRTIQTKAEMHARIDALTDDDHAILIVATAVEDENNDRMIDVAWKNVSAWQAEGMLRSAIRFVWNDTNDEGHHTQEVD